MERENFIILPQFSENCADTVRQQLCVWDAVFAFKCLAGCVSVYVTFKLATRGQVSGRVTRSLQQLTNPKQLLVSDHSSSVFSLWNSLDKDLKLSKNHRNFKHRN